MMYLPSIVAVSIHFDANRALATGVVVCGSGNYLVKSPFQSLFEETGIPRLDADILVIIGI